MVRLLRLFILFFMFPTSASYAQSVATKEKMYSDQELYAIIDTLLNNTKPNKFIVHQLLTYVNWRQNVVPGDDHYNWWDIKTIDPYKGKELAKKDSVLAIDFKEFYSDFVPPVVGAVTSNFGCRNKRIHKGIDLDLNTGDQVVAAFAGMVRIAQRDKGYGNVVIVRHYNGLETTYAHLSRIKVKTGQLVAAGQLVGLGGNTGHSEGSHLHFEIRFKGIAINPNHFISFKENKLLAQDFVLKKVKGGYTAFPLGCKTYKIHRGDSLYIIAQRHGLTISKLKALNGFGKSFTLKVGQEIRVG